MDRSEQGADTGSADESTAAPELLTLCPAPADSLVGLLALDRYRILERLGSGGMGTVYLAEHVMLGKKVALKVLRAEHCREAEAVHRFLREARAASTIHHPNIVDILDYGELENGHVGFAMEYLVGEDLGALLKRQGTLPWERVARLLTHVCNALGAAHERGIVHRDLKPENCYRVERPDDPDFVKLVDFGIAKLVSREGMQTDGLTTTGTVMGTPEYMSPEQARGEPPDPRSDIYSVGVMAYRMLTGVLPFRGANFMAILAQHLIDPVPLPSAIDPRIPPGVEALLLNALDKNPKHRFQSTAEMLAAIASLDERGGGWPVGVPRSSRPTRSVARYGAIGFTVVLGASAAWFVAPDGQRPVTDVDVTVASAPVQDDELVKRSDPPRPRTDAPVVAPIVPVAAPEPTATSDPPIVASSAKEPRVADRTRAARKSTGALKSADDPIPSSTPSILAPEPSAAELQTAIETRDDAVKRCAQGVWPGTKVNVKLVFSGSTGEVRRADPIAPYASSPLGRCLADALRAIRLAPFSAESYTHKVRVEL